LSNHIQGSISPEIRPVVKALLGDFHGVSLIGLDLTDKAAAALLNELRIQT